MWMGTIGSVSGAVHRPTCPGSAPSLATDTVTVAEVVSFPAPSGDGGERVVTVAHE